MTATMMPSPVFTILDGDGAIVPGGKLFVYLAGTSTKATTYQDAALATENTNPVLADAAGRVAVYLAPGSYKFKAAPANDTDPPANAYWTRDYVSSVPPTNVDLDIQGTAGETMVAGQACYLSDGSGGKTAGQWYLADADFTYASTLALALGVCVDGIGVGEEGSIRQAGRITGLSGLTAGTSYYVSATAGALTATPPANAIILGVADSTTSILLSYWATFAGVGADIIAIEADITAIETILNDAKGSTASVDARLDVSIAADGYLVDPLPKTVSHTAGTGSNTGRAPMTFDSITAAAGNTSTGETTLWTKSLTGGSLNVDGKWLTVTMWGSMAANANTKTLKFKFGATSITFASSTFGSNAVLWRAQATLVRRSATTQYAVVQMMHDQLGSNTPAPVQSAAGETLSGAVTVSVTGQGGATNDIVMQGLVAELH